MRTPYFDELCAEIRGLDLGDDAALLERLGARIGADRAAVEPEAWLLYAVLHARRDDVDAALAALMHADTAGAAGNTVAFMAAHLLAQRGEYQGAHAALDSASGPAPEPIATADLEHARGALAWARGDLARALVHFRAGLDDDPHDAMRWMETGRALAAAQQWDEAERAFEHALVQDEELDDAHYERACVWLSCDRVADAAAALAELADRNPGIRERATGDPRWLAARSHPAVVAVLSRSPTTPSWLPETPAWLPPLVRDPAIAALGIHWLDAGASASIMNRLLEHDDRGAPGTMHTPTTLAFAREQRRNTVVIAQGPTLRGRDRGEVVVLWLLDRQQDRLYMALSESYPAFLWIPAGRDLEGMGAALAPFIPQPYPSRIELPARVRGFLGYRLRFGVPSPYTGELDPANAAELDRHFALNPFVEQGAWGSSRIDDPWPEQLPAQPLLQLRMTAREQVVTQQTPGRVWSISRRTRHSRSILTIELHHRDVFVAELRYQPALHAAVVAAVNAQFGSDYPIDLPLDALAALLGFRFDSATDLEAQLDGPDASDTPALAAGLLQVISALRHDELSVTTLYRRWLEHADPVVRSTLYNVFVAHNHESLLEEACVTERDPEMLAQIEGILDDGIAVVQWDPYRDYTLGDD